MCTRNYCDYDNYYKDQAGGNLDISYYRAYPYQRGYGRFSSFAKKYGIPAIKYLFKHGVEFGKDMYSDIREGKNVAESFKRNLRKRAGSAFTDIGEKFTQSGSGLRKKPRYKVNKKKTYKKTKRIQNKKPKKQVKKKKPKRRCSKKLKFGTDIFN